VFNSEAHVRRLGRSIVPLLRPCSTGGPAGGLCCCRNLRPSQRDRQMGGGGVSYSRLTRWSSVQWGRRSNLCKQCHSSGHLLQRRCGLWWEAILSWWQGVNHTWERPQRNLKLYTSCSFQKQTPEILALPVRWWCGRKLENDALTMLYLEVGRCCQAILQPLETGALQNQTWKIKQRNQLKTVFRKYVSLYIYFTHGIPWWHTENPF